MAVAATGILIYNDMTKPDHMKSEETIAEEFKQWRESNSARKSAYKSASAALVHYSGRLFPYQLRNKAVAYNLAHLSDCICRQQYS